LLWLALSIYGYSFARTIAKDSRDSEAAGHVPRFSDKHTVCPGKKPSISHRYCTNVVMLCAGSKYVNVSPDTLTELSVAMPPLAVVW